MTLVEIAKKIVEVNSYGSIEDRITVRVHKEDLTNSILSALAEERSAAVAKAFMDAMPLITTARETARKDALEYAAKIAEEYSHAIGANIAGRIRRCIQEIK